MPRWRMTALGAAALHGPKQLVPEKKTAAVLLYLALSGPTPRSRLAGLLWPGSSEAAARNNLSQTLRRLRLATDDALIVGDDLLRLGPEVEVDAARLKVEAFAGEYGQVLSAQGELLAGFDYDDCPEFADWLYGEREALAEAQRDALRNLVEAALERGDLSGAIRFSERLLERDPLLESGYRHLMRLYYQAGDRPAALRVYHRCQEVLARELGVEPLPQTQELARKIDQGEVRAAPVSAKPDIPLELLRPPRLVGRGAEWAQLEAAWAAGQAIFVSGPSGVGKSRLLRDFAASRGHHLFFEARPGDAALPYATQTRIFRDLLTDHRVALPDWVRTELSRLLPELGPAPGPLAAEADRHRFYEAMAWVFRALAEAAPLVWVLDDLQFCDAASLAAQRYLYASLQGSGARGLYAFRSGELPEELQRALDGLVSAGQALHLELAPLGAEATSALLETLELPEGQALGAPLLRYTGGNPLFILETVRHLFETGQLGHALPQQLPPPGKAVTVLRRRFEALSPAAQRLAQAAATLEGEFDPLLVARLLERDPLELLSTWEELERQHITSGSRFSHDLMLETVRASVPAPVGAVLHERAYEVLKAADAPAAILARHAEGAGRLRDALELHLRAAKRAAGSFALFDAAESYRRAQALLADNPELAEGVSAAELRDLYYQLGFIYVYTNAFDEARALDRQGLELARREGLDELEWLVLSHLAYLAVHDGYDLAAASRYAEEALEVARRSGDERHLVEASQELAGLYTLAFAPGEALRYAESALELAERLGDPALLARSLMEVELAHWQLGHWQEALALLERAAGLYRQAGDAALEARARHSLAFDQVAAGQATPGLESARRALQLARRARARREEVNAAGVLALALRERGLLGPALEHAEAALEVAGGLGVSVLEVQALRRLALVRLDRYELDEAEALLDRAETLTSALARRPRAGEIAALRCRAAWLRGEGEIARAQAERALGSRDLREAEAWIARWPLLWALQDASVSLSASAAQLCQPLLVKSPRHRLEGLRCQALGAPSAAEALALLEEALALAGALELPQEIWRGHAFLAALVPAPARHVREAERALDALAASVPEPERARFRERAALELRALLERLPPALTPPRDHHDHEVSPI